MTLVLDTNIIISSQWKRVGNEAKVFGLWQKGVIDLATSPPILKEYKAVLERPYFTQRLNLTSDSISQLIQLFKANTISVPGITPVNLIKDDPSDNKFLSCGIEAQADYIISGDKHLKKLKVFEGIPIVTAQQFLTRENLL